MDQSTQRQKGQKYAQQHAKKTGSISALSYRQTSFAAKVQEDLRQDDSYNDDCGDDQANGNTFRPGEQIDIAVVFIGPDRQ